MSTPTLLVAVSAAWMLFGLVVGWLAVRTPDRRLGPGPITRLRPWERSLVPYRIIGIRHWKDLLPEAGDFFRGGVSKRHLPDGSVGTLQRFVVETRRAERVHWSLVVVAPTFFIWTPAGFAVPNLFIALAANLPFVAIQRYNRVRLERAIRRAGDDPDALCRLPATVAELAIG